MLASVGRYSPAAHKAHAVNPCDTDAFKMLEHAMHAVKPTVAFVMVLPVHDGHSVWPYPVATVPVKGQPRETSTATPPQP